MDNNNPDRRRAWREDRKRRLAMEAAHVTHGTTNAYVNYGCRCDPCKAARAEESAQRYAAEAEVRARMLARTHRYRRSVTGNPEKWRTLWTSADMSIATERDSSGKYVRTRAEAARMLGRSYNAVAKIRERCLRDPRYIESAGEPDRPLSKGA